MSADESAAVVAAPAPTVDDILTLLAAEADEEHDTDNALDTEGGLNAGAGIST